MCFGADVLDGGLATRRGGGDCFGDRGGGMRGGLTARGGGVICERSGRSSPKGAVFVAATTKTQSEATSQAQYHHFNLHAIKPRGMV